MRFIMGQIQQITVCVNPTQMYTKRCLLPDYQVKQNKQTNKQTKNHTHIISLNTDTEIHQQSDESWENKDMSGTGSTAVGWYYVCVCVFFLRTQKCVGFFFPHLPNMHQCNPRYPPRTTQPAFSHGTRILPAQPKCRQIRHRICTSSRS